MATPAEFWPRRRHVRESGGAKEPDWRPGFAAAAVFVRVTAAVDYLERDSTQRRVAVIIGACRDRRATGGFGLRRRQRYQTLDAMVEAPKPRRDLYNASVTYLRRVHDDLLILRVTPDDGPVTFAPGQYTVLGLGDWEPRVSGVQPEPPFAADRPRLIERAYSFSATMIDADERLVAPHTQRDHEFYVALVRFAGERAPALTPRLFSLVEGSRIFMGRHVHGRYTTSGVAIDDDVAFVATGTGEAPHNAMVAHLLATGHRGRIVSIACVRYRRDLAYLAAHQALMRQFSQYQYIPLTTREPENTDPAAPGFMGKRYLQEFFTNGDFERETGLVLRPGQLHLFLCGNPAMIGVEHRPGATTHSVAASRGMVAVLADRGFAVDHPHSPGSIHFETYW